VKKAMLPYKGKSPAEAIKIKMEYNKKRPFKHGNKKI
jgi:hypothetical protein